MTSFLERLARRMVIRPRWLVVAGAAAAVLAVALVACDIEGDTFRMNLVNDTEERLEFRACLGDCGTVPLAALYVYALRNPERFRGVFWIAFIEQSAAIVSNLYH